MKNENTIRAKRQSDGTLVQVLPDGSTKPFEDATDWARLRAMTDEEPPPRWPIRTRSL